MIILIAESKTMSDSQSAFPEAYRAGHIPVDEGFSDETMSRIAGLTVGEIVDISRFSKPMAMKLRQMAIDFPDKSVGLKAVEAYTGVVFRNFDYNSLLVGERTEVSQRLRIVSSLYGLLRPDDVIKPYRLDYTTKLGPDGEPMSKALRERVTNRLIEELMESGEREMLDLLPGDAMKCINISALGDNIRIGKVDFREVEGNKVSSPHATKLKALRGELLRSVFIHKLDTLEKIAGFSGQNMMGSGEVDDNGVITFFV